MLKTLAPLTPAADGGSAFGAIGDWAVSIMNFLGAPGVGLLVLFENLFPPIPSEIILPLAGFTAGSPDGSFTWVEALIWATAGSVIGAYLLYGLGAWLGHDRTVKLLSYLPLVDREDIDKTIAWFNKHGYWTVFVGRMVPIFRSLISIPAGVERMSWWRFGLFTFAGSAIWNTIFVYGGFVLGNNWQVLEEVAGWFQYIVIAAVVALVIWYIVHKIIKARREQRSKG
ncbi:MAG: DedA family protein [Gulosibacter sp.]|uniref:DedA family protein n=1 Tax=Gulosibacter sp. TaxID=2817531 RepID=UPI003F8EBB9F